MRSGCGLWTNVDVATNVLEHVPLLWCVGTDHTNILKSKAFEEAQTCFIPSWYRIDPRTGGGIVFIPWFWFWWMCYFVSFHAFVDSWWKMQNLKSGEPTRDWFDGEHCQAFRSDSNLGREALALEISDLFRCFHSRIMWDTIDAIGQFVQCCIKIAGISAVFGP